MGEDNFASKINDLTNSLNRTTDVLSTADRMIDHYRDLSREQEHEIARLQNDLHLLSSSKTAVPQQPQPLHLYQPEQTFQKSHLSSDAKSFQRKYESDSDCYSTASRRKYPSKRHKHKRKSKSSSRVRFKERDSSFSDNDLDISLQELEERQDRLEQASRREKFLRERELDDMSLRKSMLKSIEDIKVKENETLNGKLQSIQEKMLEEHETWKKQQMEMKNMADEMKSLKDSVKEALTPKPVKKYLRSVSSPDVDAVNLKSFEKKIQDSQKTISFLQEELDRKEREHKGIEDTLHDIQNLNNMKSNQLQLIEHQLQQEKTERLKLSSTVESLQEKALTLEKERSEMLHLISELKKEASSSKMALEKSHKSTIPQLKLLLERSEQQRDRFFDQLSSLQNELALNEEKLKQITHQKDELENKLSLQQLDNNKHRNEAGHAQSRYLSCEKELEKVKTEISEYRKKLQLVTKSKADLKQKALDTIREYKSKCRVYEKQIDQLQDEKNQSTHESSVRQNLETRLSTLQNQFHDTNNRMESFKRELLQSEANCHEEKIKLKDTLLKYKNLSDEHSTMKLENNRLQLSERQLQIEKQEISEELENLVDKNKSLTKRYDECSSKNKQLEDQLHEYYEKNKQLENQLHEHYEKNKQLENQLHDYFEKMLLTKETSQKSFKHQLEVEEEKYKKLLNTHEQTKHNMEREINELKHTVDKLRTEVENSERERHSTHQEMLKYSAKYRDLKETHEKEASESTSYKSVIQEMRTKLKSYIEENRKLKNRYQALKSESESKSKILKEINENQQQQNEKNIVLNKGSDKIDVSKMLTLIMGDMENLHRLLSYEDEDQIPIKEIPDHLPSDIQDRLKDFRNKFNSCFTVVRTLKERYYQHKLLIKKAQEKIKSLISDKGEEKTAFEERFKECNSKNDFYRGQIKSLESQLSNSTDAVKDKDTKIENLQAKVATLTKHLEECTRALHASIEAEHERKKVLGEIEQLKFEREEHQKIDENFYRCSEKLDLLSEQLSEAKNSLTQIKKDNMDESLFTTKLIQTFGSVSPSRKRKLFLFDSPISKSSLRNTDGSSRTTTNEKDTRKFPMALNDEEFNEFLLSTPRKEDKSKQRNNLIDDSIT